MTMLDKCPFPSDVVATALSYGVLPRLRITAQLDHMRNQAYEGSSQLREVLPGQNSE